MSDICAEHSCPTRECEGVTLTLTLAVNDTQCAGLARLLIWAGLAAAGWLMLVVPLLLITAAIRAR